MRTGTLIALALALALAGCGGDSDDGTSGREGTTPAGDARPVSPNVEPRKTQAVTLNKFTACASKQGYFPFMGPPIQGGASSGFDKPDREGPMVVFLIFPDSTAAAIAASRDQQEVASGGIVRNGLTVLVAYNAADLAALKPCVQSAG